MHGTLTAGGALQQSGEPRKSDGAPMEKRNASLDILRAAAIILVINCHIAATWDLSGPCDTFRLGGRGVDLFFVLSGWLLGRQLLVELRRTNTLDITRFWYRRWMRTLPAYYAVLLLTFAQQVFVLGNYRLYLSYFIFTQNYQIPMPYFGVSWSLCVEEYFYLLIAPALLVFFRFRWLRVAIVPLMVVPSLCRWMGWYTDHGQTHVRYDQCAVGVLLAALDVFAPRLWSWLCRLAPYLAVGTLAALAIPVANRLGLRGWNVDYGDLTYAGLFAVLVLLANSSTLYRERLRSRFFRYLADRAYSLYLTHIEALVLVHKFKGLPTVAYFALSWAVSLLCAEALYRSIERPFMRLRDRPRVTSSPGEARALEAPAVPAVSALPMTAEASGAASGA
jgi:peptidoglycan/LPS O-acetylase OafA/YrhL